MKITNDEARTVILMKEAIASLGMLVIHCRKKEHGLDFETVAMIEEADLMLNHAEDRIISDDPEEHCWYCNPTRRETGFQGKRG